MAESFKPLRSWFRVTFFGIVIPLLGLALIMSLAKNALAFQEVESTGAAPQTTVVEEDGPTILVDSWRNGAAGQAAVDKAAEVVSPTTLSVAILSTPWAVLDSNNPAGSPADPAPNVFMVEAVVTNTGDYDAVDLQLILDYNEDPVNGWLLAPNEVPLRTPASDLAPGESFYGYWFASYPPVLEQSHQYTVTAHSEGVAPVSTSANYFVEPAPGATVTTDSFISSGNSEVTGFTADIIIGVAYTITVNYDLGTNPQFLIMSPAGNANFDAGSARVLNSSVRLYNGDDPNGTVITNRLFLPSLPDVAGSPPASAEVTYNLLPIRPASTQLCPYGAVGFNSQHKYDQFYCDAGHSTIIDIEGDVSISMTKQTDASYVQQDGILTYTINYTNDGTVPLQEVWVWDELDPAVASVISGTATPAPDLAESTEHRVAWFIGDLPAAGQPGDSGTMTFQARVDGGGADLADGSEVVNHAYFGVNPGSLPPAPALTATIISTVQAPAITLSKSDGQDEIGNGQQLTYTVYVANDGSVSAVDLVLTDTLPVEVALAGPPIPAADDTQGQVLVWTSLPDLAPGEMLTLTVPVTVDLGTPSFLELINQAEFAYSNTLGHRYDVETATDTTEVFRQAGFVDGYAFVDSAGDGIFDGDELRLSGVQVTLPAALSPTVTTDVDGYYRFRVEVEQPISVTAGLPGGYFRTTPGQVLLENAFNITNTVNFGYAPESAEFGVVYGFVYGDEDHNGLQDAGESGLPGVIISATAAVTSPVVTGAYGDYTLRFNSSGSFAIEESNPAGYVSTTPDLVQVNVVTGSDQGSPVNFGDFWGVKIEGKVFDDLDADGQDDGDPGLSGAVVAAGGDMVTTASSGLYTLYASLAGGPLLITETDPPGYVSTVAVPGSGMARVDNGTLSIDSPVSGTVYQEGLFGDVATSGVITITGVVWDDNGDGGGQEANGQRDGLEPGLSGVLLSASSGMSTQTAADGSFTLHAPPGVSITVTEQNPTGYVSTNAIPGNDAQKIDDDQLLVTGLSAGQSSAGNQFGDVQENNVAEFSGAVWNDNGQNGAVANDGIWQVGQEQPLAGATVSLSSGMSAVTGPDGSYQLFGPPGAAITITEQNLAGYLSSGSIAGPGASVHDKDNIVVAAPVAGQLYDENYFGDLLAADLSISKSDAPDPVAAGGLVTYTLTYQNLGPASALVVTIVDTLPDDVTFLEVVEEDPAVDDFQQNGQELTWSLASLSSGGSGSIVFTVQVDPDVIGAVFNQVTISSETFDQVPANNTDESETAIGTPDQATIYGHVFEDLNINGAFDDGEAGLSDVVLWLDGVVSTTTDADGLYYFITDQAGIHSLTEVDPAGYMSTTSNERVVEIALGTSRRVNFGDAPESLEAAAIYGTVFDDENSNAIWDGTETGLPGVTITLDSQLTAVTDVYGGYTFSTTVTGTHTVVETDPPYYFSTTPNMVMVAVQYGHSYEENFGDVQADVATCDPDQFEDDDLVGDAVQLPPNSSQRHDFCDDAVDWTVFSASQGSVYTITTSSFDQRADTYIGLYDSDGQTLLAANDDHDGSTDFSSMLVWQATNSGDFYVRTTNMAGVTGRHTEYDIQLQQELRFIQYIPVVVSSSADKSDAMEKLLRRTGSLASTDGPLPDGGVGPLGVINHMCPDAYEVDDTWMTAAPVADGQTYIHSFDSDPVLYAADKDYMSFSLLPLQSITFTVTTVTNTLTMLEAYDAQGHSLGLTGTDELALLDMPGGTYYVSVSPLNSTNYGCANEVGYEIAVDFSPRSVQYVPFVIK